MTAPKPAETLFWAKFVSGNADRVIRRQLTQAALERIREGTAQHVTWGIEPMPPQDHD
jgi:hypothetical protein